MNIMRSWREQMVMLKWRFPELCDEDLKFEDGHKDVMLNRLSIKLNKTGAELDLLFIELQTY